MRNQRVRGVWAVAACCAVGAWGMPAFGAPTMFGSLGNFDVINDTGEVCRGFEIELEGVHSADIAYTFGTPYIRYGDPTMTDTATGCIVRYASAWGPSGWLTGTPTQDPNNPVITGGHQLFYPEYGGDPNYINLPGDHFGLAFNNNPTNTIYRWLTGDASGNLLLAGTNVKLPAPAWKVTPPANLVDPPIVQAVVPALPRANEEDVFGEAIWVKVFVTESPDPAKLENLLVGDPEMPEESEVEIEWVLLQAGKDPNDEMESPVKEMGADSKSITRRYEYYAYVGGYNSEGEALTEKVGDNLVNVGRFLGGQNAAFNLIPFEFAPVDVPEPTSLGLLGLGLVGLLGRRRR